jgi:hypothetical protein
VCRVESYCNVFSCKWDDAPRTVGAHSPRQVNPQLSSVTEDALNSVFESSVHSDTSRLHAPVIVLLGVLHSIGYATLISLKRRSDILIR